LYSTLIRFTQKPFHSFSQKSQRIRIEKQKELSRVLQSATEKLNILTVLEEERNFLNKMISMQTKKKEMSSYSQQQQQREEIGSDLDKLKEISNHQKEQIEVCDMMMIVIHKSYLFFLGMLLYFSDATTRNSSTKLKDEIIC
jgi:hypothetical protein